MPRDLLHTVPGRGPGRTRESKIPCFHCGERNELEFTYGGPARIRLLPTHATAAEWAAHLRRCEEPKSMNFERWCHTFGCGEWFHLARDIRTREIRSVFPLRGFRSPPAAAVQD